MTLQKRLVRHGNSYALVIDKTLMELLELDVRAPVEISTPDGKSLVIRQARTLEGEELVQRTLDRIEKRYSNAMKRLAE